MSAARYALGAMFLVLVAGPMFGQAPQPLLRFTFDSSDEGWTGLGANCRASVTTQSSYNGTGCLKFEYDLRPRTMGMLAYTPHEGALRGAKSFRFWVRTDQSTSLAFFVQEKGGGRFTAMFAVPKGMWQKVEVAVDDLVLNEGKDDPKDENGRLDTDQIEALAVGDIAQFLAQGENPEFARLLGLELGPRVLLLDDFTASTEPLPAAVSVSSREVRLDTFARPQACWLASCGARVVKGASGTPPALEATYRQAVGRIVALARVFPRGTLKGMSQIGFTVSSKQRVMLLVQLEEAGGGKFNTIIEIPEGTESKAVTVQTSSLNAADDSAVRDRPIKMELVSQLVFIDATMLTGMASDQDNTLVVRDLRAVTAENR